MKKTLYCSAFIGLLFYPGNFCSKAQEPKLQKQAEEKLPAQLKRDGIMITDKAYKQIFQAYIGKASVFITTDSLLNAYHVLYEESIFQLEKKQTGVLENIVTELYQQLCRGEIHDKFSFTGKMTQKAILLDKLIVGVAVKLFKPQFKLDDPVLDKQANDEVKKIIEAKEVRMPEWLGKASDSFAGVDYSRFKPRGFYDKTPQLQKYFMATAWLQVIPFQVKDDEQLLAFMILRECWHQLSDSFPEGEKYRLFFDIYDVLLGKQDGQGINGGSTYSSSYGKDDLEELRKELAASPATQINDTLRTKPSPDKGITDLRIMPARKTPDAILFSLTTDPRYTQKDIPSGLEVSALLGSKFAMNQLPVKVRGIVEKKRSIINNNSLYGRYLGALKALFENNAPRLPQFMKNKSWEIKSCNTALTGWTQLRHTWSLQAKQTVNYLGLTGPSNGFVEPNEAFWRRMAMLCEYTRSVLTRLDCFSYNPADDITLYKKLASLLQTHDMETIISKYPEVIQVAEPAFAAIYIFTKGKEAKSEKERKQQYIAGLKKLISILESNSLDKYPKLEYLYKCYAVDLNNLWVKLHTTSLKLQVISIKQLHCIALSDDENEFIANYGKIIAAIMLYGGNSYLTPQDDAVRAVDVFTDVKTYKAPRFLEVGVGRARELLVLYPSAKGNVLCKGAVLPYYEFFSDKRLTDSEWKTMLDSPKKRPEVPQWLTPIIQNGKLQVPLMKKAD